MRKGSYQDSPAEPGLELTRNPAEPAHFRTRRVDPFPAPCPLLPQQSRRVDSGGTVGPKSLCAFPEGSIRLWSPGEALEEGATYRDLRSGVGMIHELLLALSGYPGSIFTWNKRSGLQVCPAQDAETDGS